MLVCLLPFDIPLKLYLKIAWYWFPVFQSQDSKHVLTPSQGGIPPLAQSPITICISSIACKGKAPLQDGTVTADTDDVALARSDLDARDGRAVSDANVRLHALVVLPYLRIMKRNINVSQMYRWHSLM